MNNHLNSCRFAICTCKMLKYFPFKFLLQKMRWYFEKNPTLSFKFLHSSRSRDSVHVCRVLKIYGCIYGSAYDKESIETIGVHRYIVIHRYIQLEVGHTGTVLSRNICFSPPPLWPNGNIHGKRERGRERERERERE